MPNFEGMKKAGRTKVDFSDAGDRGPFNPKYQDAGDYLFKIVAVLDSPTKEKKEPQWIFALQDVENKSAIYPYRCKLEKNQAWKIRNVFEAVGISVPQKMMNVDPQKVVGKLIGATLEDNEFNGKVRSQIGDVFPASEFGDAKDADEDDDDVDEVEDDVEDDEEDEPEPPKKKAPTKKSTAKKPAPKKRKEPEPEEDEDEDEDVEDGDDEELEVEDL